jgi:Xaa-Pro aminopeptidase
LNARRLDAVREALARRGLDGAVAVAPEHVWWLAGDESGRIATVVVSAEGAVALEAGAADDALAGTAADLGLAGRTLAYDTAEAAGAFADARRAKDADDLRALEHAAAVVDTALAAARDATVAGASDHEVHDAAAAALLAAAGPDCRPEGNVGAGINGSDPDAVPIGVALAEHDWLFIDLYPRIGHHYGDATRAFSAGPPSDRAVALHRTLWAALDHAAGGLRPGARAGDIDARCRAVLARDDLESFFPHHTGHGLGLFQQEAPMLVPGNDDELRVGDVVTIEPGVYLPGVGGMRVEDVFVIEPDGARRLTGAPRELWSGAGG